MGTDNSSVYNIVVSMPGVHVPAVRVCGQLYSCMYYMYSPALMVLAMTLITIDTALDTQEYSTGNRDKNIVVLWWGKGGMD